MAVGRSLTSLETAMVIHAIAAPAIFGVLAALYFTLFPRASGAATAAA
jgi:hypothetical protein